MSTALAHTDCSSISVFSDTGSGTDFEKLKELYSSIIRDFIGPEVTAGQKRVDTLYSLDEVFKDCSEKGWDGYDALPITEGAYIEAQRLIKSLPLTSFFPLPEIIPEPNGDIGLEWRKGKRQLLVASVRGKNEIIYAGLFGMEKPRGITYFGDSLPSIIIEHLKTLYRD